MSCFYGAPMTIWGTTAKDVSPPKPETCEQEIRRILRKATYHEGERLNEAIVPLAKRVDDLRSGQ